MQKPQFPEYIKQLTPTKAWSKKTSIAARIPLNHENKNEKIYIGKL